MKHHLSTLALALVGAALTVSTAAAQPQGTTTIVFDDFCDGLTLNVSGTFVNGTHNNWDCQGSNGTLNGAVASISRVSPALLRPKSMIAVGDSVAPGALGCPANIYVDFSTNRWTIYFSCNGEPEALLNRGTFTIAPPAARGRAGRPALMRLPGTIKDDSDAAAAAPTGPYTITLDTLCDYFVVSSNGNKLGATHNAEACGLGNFVATGNNQRQSDDQTGTDGDGALLNSTAAAVTDINNCVTNYYFSFDSNVFSGYIACNGQPPTSYVSGTFTITPGTAKPNPGGNRPSFGR